MDRNDDVSGFLYTQSFVFQSLLDGCVNAVAKAANAEFVYYKYNSFTSRNASTKLKQTHNLSHSFANAPT